jgi:hypothetical protein
MNPVAQVVGSVEYRPVAGPCLLRWWRRTGDNVRCPLCQIVQSDFDFAIGVADRHGVAVPFFLQATINPVSPLLAERVRYLRQEPGRCVRELDPAMGE